MTWNSAVLNENNIRRRNNNYGNLNGHKRNWNNVERKYMHLMLGLLDLRS